MGTDETIKAALLTEAPRVAELYKATTLATFSRLVDSLGPNLKGIYNNKLIHQFRSIRGSIDEKPLPWSLEHGTLCEYSINPEKLEAESKSYSERAVLEWAGKIISKVGDLTDVTIQSLGRTTFSIRGKRGPDEVNIEQSMTVNCSPRGVLFNQFPARIYVNGKFTPAAKYNKAA